MSTDPFLPDDYSMTIMSSLTASCAFIALSRVLEGKPEREEVIESMFKTWRTVWQAKFQDDMQEYTKLLTDGRVKGAIDQLTSTEEFQSQFNRTLREVENSARAALFPEDVK